jgi:hypothetical protein
MGDFWRGVLKGAVGPRANDSRFLLDVHSRDLPGEQTMRRYADGDEVDLVIVGAGAGGSVLAQRLARRGWRIVVLEAGPFWHPDQDWVSDEAGSHQLYWTQDRVIGGADPIELGKNNSGRGVGGSMVHYAGYTPRFHPSDFSTLTDDGVGADWPITYRDLLPHYEQVERELPVAGQNWPWGHPHRYPFSPHPVTGAAAKLREGARRCGIEMRVGPVGIVNGTFGNRPHCTYRGYCLQGCKVNAKASPYVTHLPDALAHAVEVRADSMALRVDVDDDTGRARGVVYADEVGGTQRLQRARAVAVAGYSIETQRLLLASTSRRATPTAWATTPTRSGATSWCRAPPRPPGAGPRNCACTRHRPRRSPPSSSTKPIGLVGLPAGSPSRPFRRCRSGGPSTSSPTGTGVGRCASTCATTTTGPPSASSTNSSRTPTTGSPSPTTSIPTANRSPAWTTR